MRFLVAVQCFRGADALEGNLCPVDDVKAPPFAAPEKWVDVSDLQFIGKRFAEHGFELSVAVELVEYQKLVTDLASDLWRKQHDKKLPDHFSSLTTLRFVQVDEGSAVLPLQAPVLSSETLFGVEPSPYVSQAIQLLYEAIHSQESGSSLPDAFPRGRLVTQLSRWGGSLLPDEAIGVGETTMKNGKRARARFSSATKSRLRNYIQDTYSEVVNLVGEIRSIDLDKLQSFIRLPNESRVEVRFDVSLSEDFQRALKGDPVSVTGLAKISRLDGYIQQLSSATAIAPARASSTAGWDDFLNDVAAKADWSNVPSDLSRRMDDYLYGEK